MRRFLRSLILLTIALLTATSCGDEPDGKWDKMKWTNVNNLMQEQGSYLIPEAGGTFRFQCRNYGHIWIASYTINGVSYPINGESLPEMDDVWFTVIIKDNIMTIVAEPLPESVESRYFSLELTAGDIFDTFVFKQQRGNHL